MAGKSLWCHDGAAFWKSTSGICCTSALWGMGKAVYRDVSHWRHSPTKPPTGNGRGSCWPPCANPWRLLLAPDKLLVLQEPVAGVIMGTARAECWRSSLCEWSEVLEKPCVREKLGAGEAIHTAAAWHQRSHPCCKGLVGEQLHALHKPDAREASDSVGACWASMLKPGRKTLLVLPSFSCALCWQNLVSC